MTIKNKLNSKPHPRLYIWLLIVACALTVGVFIYANWVLKIIHTELFLMEVESQHQQDKIFLQMIKKEKEEAMISEVEPEKWSKATMTMYNVGDPNQNSGDPCITASGDNGCELLEQGGNYCASNFLPFGTEIFVCIEDVGCLGNCLVIDVVPNKQTHWIDWMMPFDGEYGAWKKEARKWGVRPILYKIEGKYDKIDGVYVQKIE